MEKTYTSDDIRSQYNKLSAPKQVQILYSALDYMQSYNGRSKILCIALAMGYENTEGGDNTYVKAL
jgi:hypothetical protein